MHSGMQWADVRSRLVVNARRSEVPRVDAARGIEADARRPVPPKGRGGQEFASDVGESCRHTCEREEKGSDEVIE
jgi:hypothetical protein